MAGRPVTLYVRESDLDLWRRAERYAQERRMTVSALVLSALEHYLDESTQ